MRWMKVFAPATIGNIGPGFDVLGLALEGMGDVIEARKVESGVRIVEVTGYDVPLEADKNTAGIAAKEVLKFLDINEGVELKIQKGMPPASGLGGSAASACAGAYITNLLFDGNLSKLELINLATRAEEVVSGDFFVNNTAPCLLGGATLTKSLRPLAVIQLGTISNLVVTVVTPSFQLLTKKAREVLPKMVGMKDFVSNMANACLIVAAFTKNDLSLLGNGINDKIVEPARANLIPGFYDVKKAARDAGAFGCSISGAGPSIFAITDDIYAGGQIGKAMQEAFARNGHNSKSYVCKINEGGVKLK